MNGYRGNEACCWYSFRKLRGRDNSSSTLHTGAWKTQLDSIKNPWVQRGITQLRSWGFALSSARKVLKGRSIEKLTFQRVNVFMICDPFYDSYDTKGIPPCWQIICLCRCIEDNTYTTSVRVTKPYRPAQSPAAIKLRSFNLSSKLNGILWFIFHSLGREKKMEKKWARNGWKKRYACC